MKRIIPVLAIILSMSGCQETEQIDLSTLSPQERDAVTSLAWLQDAEASRDAKLAIERGDKRLLAMATRAPNMPGVPTESASRIKSVCGIRYLEGSTDMVFGDTHLKLLQAAQEYATEYNKLMLDACLKQTQ
ncbi:MAG: glutamyl-tRNA amidotransferase [Gammaproteobacteria bacterium]|nr:glutamyl-tRNA amidotransferase [Gammaproteobacteria bacterium]